MYKMYNLYKMGGSVCTRFVQNVQMCLYISKIFVHLRNKSKRQIEMKERSDELIRLLKLHKVNISKMEDELGIPAGGVRLSGRGIPVKYHKLVSGYLDRLGVVMQAVMNEDNEGVVARKVLRWNDGRVPEWRDGIKRYRDEETGLWIRYDDNCTVIDKSSGKRVPRTVWAAQTGELLQDEIGEFFVANNGIKVYLFSREEEE